MNRKIKLVSVVGCVLLVTIPATLLSIPYFLDARKYEPLIEQKVFDAIGRPFEVGSQLRLSLFPRTRVWFSDLHLANPTGFAEKNLIKVNILEVRFKLLPFIFSGFKNIQVVGFLLKNPQIILVKNADGRLNWEGLTNPYDMILKIMQFHYFYRGL